MPYGRGARKRKNAKRSAKHQTKIDVLKLEELFAAESPSRKNPQIKKAMNLLAELEVKYRKGQITDAEERLLIRLIGLKNKLSRKSSL